VSHRETGAIKKHINASKHMYNGYTRSTEKLLSDVNNFSLPSQNDFPPFLKF
jgi:hypothetical protein